MNNRPSIRRAKGEEAAVLSDIAFRSKAYWGYDEPFMEACREELTYSAVELSRHPFYLSETDGQITGFYALYPYPETAVLELEALFVDPAAMGQGIGQRLMTHAKQTAHQRGASQLIIQSDPHAASFYTKMGGVLTGKRPSASIPGRTLPIFRIHIN